MSSLWKKTNSLPILQVLMDHGVKVEGSGDNLKAVSPFRRSTNPGSFTVCISRNTFRDWKLDYGGGPVKFIEKLLGLSPKEAEEYLNKRYFTGGTVGEIKLFVPPAETPKVVLDRDKMDMAYRIFLDMCSLVKDDEDYLKTVRHLSDEEIRLIGFKSFPRRTIRHELQQKLVDAGINPTEIPGFFQYEDDECITFSYYVGIIIPIKDIEGRIVGLQVRKRNLKSETDNRYVWLSSSFAQNKPGEKKKFRVNGLSPQSPIGFVPSTFNPASVTTLFVTEGFFKGYSFKQYLRSPSLYVQGVTNWKEIVGIIKNDIPKIYPNLNRVVFAFDADFIENLNVSGQACKMWTAIEKEVGDKYRFFAMLWQEAEGKGIDDLFEAVGKDHIAEHIHLMPMETYSEAFNEFEPIGKKFLEDDVDKATFVAEYGRILKGKISQPKR